MVERCVRDAEAAGSNPVASTKQGLESVCAPSLSSFCKGAFSLLYWDFIRIINCIFVLIFSKQLLKKHLDFQINATRFTSRIDCIYIRAASFVIAHILQHAFFVLLFIF